MARSAETIARSSREQYKKNRAERLAYAREYYRSADKEKWKATNRATTARLKERVFEYLGAKCEHCGYSDIRALNVDHIHGAEEPQGHYRRSGPGLYRNILSGVTPRDAVQTLCANCNTIKRHDNDEVRRNRRERYGT